jgi:hypothetical protein
MRDRAAGSATNFGPPVNGRLLSAGDRMSNTQMKQHADAQFRKLPGAEAGNDARPEYEAAADALADKIARLKELRLARDAAEQAAPPKPVAGKKPGKKNSKTKRPALSSGLSLADWLKDRHAGGHKN